MLNEKRKRSKPRADALVGQKDELIIPYSGKILGKKDKERVYWREEKSSVQISGKRLRKKRETRPADQAVKEDKNEDIGGSLKKKKRYPRNYLLNRERVPDFE